MTLKDALIQADRRRQEKAQQDAKAMEPIREAFRDVLDLLGSEEVRVFENNITLLKGKHWGIEVNYDPADRSYYVRSGNRPATSWSHPDSVIDFIAEVVLDFYPGVMEELKDEK